jgi:hypothetical protein
MERDALNKMTVADLRDQAKKISGAKGLSSMKKDELIDLLLGQTGAAKAPEGRAGRTAASKPLDKTGVKQQIKTLKDEKREALAQHDHAKARTCNRQIHRYKRMLRKMTRVKAGDPKP